MADASETLKRKRSELVQLDAEHKARTAELRACVSALEETHKDAEERRGVMETVQGDAVAVRVIQSMLALHNFVIVGGQSRDKASSIVQEATTGYESVLWTSDGKRVCVSRSRGDPENAGAVTVIDDAASLTETGLCSVAKTDSKHVLILVGGNEETTREFGERLLKSSRKHEAGI